MRSTFPVITLTFLVCLAVGRGVATEPAKAADPADGSQAGQSPGLTEVELSCVDDEAVGYATFQSHNQKVISNGHGIFITHIRTRNQAYTAQTWRLSRSTDGGRTFSFFRIKAGDDFGDSGQLLDDSSSLR